MKIFISSLVRDLEAYRDAAADASRTLRHNVKRSEDFAASPDTPQRACLAGIRWADVVILILGAGYGDIQPSGLSATHEEYREARDRCTVLVFVQGGVDHDPGQVEFISETRNWATGHFTASFTTADDLRDQVVRALHEYEMARAVGPLDEDEMLERAKLLVPSDRYLVTPTLSVIVAGGPRQQIIRPVELDSPELERTLQQEAFFGSSAVLDRAAGTRVARKDNAMRLEQDGASVLLDETGSIRIVVSARAERRASGYQLPVVIEEEVAERIHRSLAFAGWVLDHVDPLRRVTHVTPVVALQRGGSTWRTREEHAASPSSMTMQQGPDPAVVNLMPGSRPRAALTQDTLRLAEDLTALLRRTVTEAR